MSEMAAFAYGVLGNRYATEFTVVAIGPGSQATLEVLGRKFTVGLDELQALVGSGLVMRVPVTDRRAVVNS